MEISHSKYNNINSLQIKHKQILDFISTLDKKIFSVVDKTHSFENREIFLIKAGTGKTKIAMWSQMHGNEPVSTMALVDFMNFLQKNDDYNNFRKKILSTCTFYFIPMLNPDGAENFTRRNAQQIDINRDAIKLCTPEGIFLNSVIDRVKPEYGFNLHDQERYYGIANSDKPTTMSFLAPAYNKAKNINDKREKSMLIIASVVNYLQKKYKLPFAKYNDTFMPIAFGDNIQQKGVSTMLFEGGYIIGDEQRQKVRDIYFDAIIKAVEIITENKMNLFALNDYKAIPENIKLKFSDLILKNLTIEKNGKKFTTDISIIRNILDKEKFTDLENEYIIWDIGDLSQNLAFKTINCQNISIKVDANEISRLKKASFLIQYCKIN